MPSPEFEKLYAAMSAQPRIIATEEEHLSRLTAVRAGMERAASRNQLPGGMVVSTVEGAPLAAELLTPQKSNDRRIILYLHGGAFTFGSIASHRHVAAWLAETAGCPAIIVDYPLAPEHPFPAAPNAILSFYNWVAGLPAAVALAGDSAGATLALVTAMAAERAPLALCALSPTVDLAAFFVDSGSNTDPSLDEGTINWAFRSYLGPNDPSHPRISPINGDLDRLPKTFVQYAKAEVFAPAAERFVGKLQASGCKVTTDAWPDMFHAWQWFAPRLPEAREALVRAGMFLLDAFEERDV
ncbi:alpha/beta hydrolase [Aminobacter sp. J44]|uniref:alpha/beta hydrolase n=1 Tax=Aminobacter sp. J44 TaxID=935262 RepID=UPI0016468A04|nr:alpha/beta hydrolase [Aminobacter sp. J44]